MEYPSSKDFFLKFKAIFNSQGMFLDYILVSVSNNFKNATKINFDRILGEKISKIVTDNENLLGLGEFYDSLIPNSRRKFEVHLEELNRWYLVNLFSDENDYLLLIYNDISRMKEQVFNLNLPDIYENNVYDIQERSRMYYKDCLTNLYTRAFFNEELKRLDTKRQLPLSVIVGDVNSLKLVNDAFGHDMGDRVLKRVAEIMKSSFRKEDIISRMGGDEFAILIPKTSESKALEIVKKMKKEYVNNPLDYLIISVSFGVATKVSENEDIKRVMQQADNRMYYSKIKENKEAKQELISHLKIKLEEITFETSAHYKRLENLSLMLAEKLGLSQTDKEELKLLCEFHDIGKIGIPKDILQKEDSLSHDEWANIKRHSEIGYQIFKETKKDLSVNDLILIHHERWDGEGYPGFLKNEEIPLVVRIFSIADAYEAMVNDRPYKKKISKREALLEIRNKSGTQFDPKLASMFIELMDEDIA